MQPCNEIVGRKTNVRLSLDPSGNWCGHDPFNPKFYTPSSENKLRPDVIQWAIGKLSEFYKKPKLWLKSICFTRTSARQERSDGREREARVIGALLDYTDLVTLRVGIPKKDGDFFSFSLKLIAKKVGWRAEADDLEDSALIEQGKQPKNKGVKRVWRSLLVLQKAGYLIVNRRFKVKEGLSGEKEYSGLSAVRCVTPKLFYELGISPKKLSIKRKEAAKRLNKKISDFKAALEIELKEKIAATTSIAKAIAGACSPFRIASLSRREQQQREHVLQQKNLKRIELRQLPENQALTVDEFYTKYPDLNTS